MTLGLRECLYRIKQRLVAKAWSIMTGVFLRQPLEEGLGGYSPPTAGVALTIPVVRVPTKSVDERVDLSAHDRIFHHGLQDPRSLSLSS